MTYTAVSEESLVRAAVEQWVAALHAHGAPQSTEGGSRVHLNELGIWIDSKGQQQPDGYRYYNALGQSLSSQTIVEVNPPGNGQPPGLFQGVVATDQAGQLCILHRGSLKTAEGKANLKDEVNQVIAQARGHEFVNVFYEGGRVEQCYIVCSLVDDATVVRQTKRFLDLCVAVRTFASGGVAAADVQKKVSLLDETPGSYLVPAQDEKQVQKKHADVWQALKAELVKRGHTPIKEWLGQVCPDIVTVDAPKMLFEIKTKSGLSDIMMALGQLMFYEKRLGEPHIKYLVIPERLPEPHLSILQQLDIRVLVYKEQSRAFVFDWPN